MILTSLGVTSEVIAAEYCFVFAVVVAVDLVGGL